MTRIDQLLAHAAQIDSPTAQLDAELLLAFVLEKPRSYLYTWPDKTATEAQVAAFMALLERRQCGEPVAYLLGRQGFWTLDLQVAKHTLIPRADTEQHQHRHIEHAAAQGADRGREEGPARVEQCSAGQQPQPDVLRQAEWRRGGAHQPHR